MPDTAWLKNLSPLRDVIKEHDLAATKKLGQHFLLDMNVTRKVARAAGDLSGVTVFEIGPGPGGLTRALLETQAKTVIAIERDHRCVAALQDLVEKADGRLELVDADALKTDLEKLGKGPRTIVANLPYNIGTELLITWLHQVDAFQSMTLMFQKEVIDRLLAPHGNKTYGRLSVLAQYCCKGERIMTLPPEAYTPPPKVTSAVIKLTPKPKSERPVPVKQLEKVTTAFNHRRKMLRGSLPFIPESVFAEAKINPTDRAEDLSVADYVRLAGLM